MSKLGRVMYCEAGVRDFSGYTVRIDPAGFYKPEQVHVFTPKELGKLLEEAFEAGYDYGDGRTHVSFGTFMKELEK